MRVLITGGHFAPAQAVIEELKKRGISVAVAGRRHPFEGDTSESYEYRTVKREKIEFFEIKAGRFQRKFSAYTLSSILKTPKGFLRARSILREFKPDVVMTFGGYIGFPIAYAAKTLGVPVVLHEQTQKVGLAASWIGKVSDKICLAFESSEKYFPREKIIITGNPIRKGVLEIEKKFEIPRSAPSAQASRKVIYITGGSSGSHFINMEISKILTDLVSEFVVIHQTGENKFGDYEMLSKIADVLDSSVRKNYILKKFVEENEIGFILQNADLVIARSGINTVCEILATGAVSLLIPLTSGQKGEQFENANLIKKIGAGEYILEKETNPISLREKITEIFANFENYKKNAKKASSLIKSNAAEKIVDVLEQIYDSKKGN